MNYLGFLLYSNCGLFFLSVLLLVALHILVLRDWVHIYWEVLWFFSRGERVFFVLLASPSQDSLSPPQGREGYWWYGECAKSFGTTTWEHSVERAKKLLLASYATFRETLTSLCLESEHPDLSGGDRTGYQNHANSHMVLMWTWEDSFATLITNPFTLLLGAAGLGDLDSWSGAIRTKDHELGASTSHILFPSSGGCKSKVQQGWLLLRQWGRSALGALSLLGRHCFPSVCV